jgi:hypothetical protein
MANNLGCGSLKSGSAEVKAFTFQPSDFRASTLLDTRTAPANQEGEFRASIAMIVDKKPAGQVIRVT